MQLSQPVSRSIPIKFSINLCRYSVLSLFKMRPISMSSFIGLSVTGEQSFLYTSFVNTTNFSKYIFLKTCFLSLMLIMGYLTQFLNLPIHMFNILVGITFVSQGIAFSNYIKEYKRMNNEKKYDILINEDSVKKDNIVYKREDSLLEQLKREKEFYISFKQPDIVKCNKRVRNMNNKRKSNN